MAENKMESDAALASEASNPESAQQAAVMALLQAGSQHLTRGALEAAAQDFREACKLDPTCVEAALRLASCLRRLDDLSGCTAILDRLLQDHPNLPEGHLIRALALERTGQLEVAEASLRKAIDLHFQFYYAHSSLGMMLLRQGRFVEGFREYEWRWQTTDFHPFRCLQPRWKGQPLDGTLLVHTEQGLGDTFQFCRYLPLIRKRCKRLLFYCSERLLPFFQANNWADQVLTPGTVTDASFDMYLPLMSAPFAFGHDLKSIPKEVPYLTPAARTVTIPAASSPNIKLKVGLVWGGSPTHSDDRHRSCHVSALAPLLAVPGVAFYSLQKAPQRNQLEGLPAHLRDPIQDIDALQADFADTAAILRQLDLLISVDTAILHLAGGLGLPAWGLLSAYSDWRWMLNREDSPWYPSVRLFRQSQIGDWDSLMKRVAEELRAKVSSR